MTGVPMVSDAQNDSLQLAVVGRPPVKTHHRLKGRSTVDVKGEPRPQSRNASDTFVLASLQEKRLQMVSSSTKG